MAEVALDLDFVALELVPVDELEFVVPTVLQAPEADTLDAQGINPGRAHIRHLSKLRRQRRLEIYRHTKEREKENTMELGEYGVAIDDLPLLDNEATAILLGHMEQARQEGSTEDEHALAGWARQQLVQANVLLVLSIAAKFPSQRRGNFMDLVQAGNLALLRAVDKYDPSRGEAKLSTYIGTAVYRAMSDHILIAGRSVYIPTAGMKRVREYEKLQGQARTPNEIPVDTPVDVKEMALVRNATSIDSPRTTKYGDYYISELIADPDAEDFVDDFAEIDRPRAIETVTSIAFEGLRRVHVRIRQTNIKMALDNLGLNKEGTPMSTQAVADKYGVRPEAVRIATRDLRKCLRTSDRTHELIDAIS